MNVKTAISLDSTLFQKAEDMTQELSISRSRLFAMAIEKLLREYENRKITTVYR
ncbi:MAG: ribbon-helix-helix domain-containing protein [Caldilineaceae bacterium]